MHNKISRIPFYFLLTAAFILQLTVLGRIKIFNARPDLPLLLVIFFGIFYGWGAGLEAGFVSGLLKDIFSAGPPGINTLTLSIAGIVIGSLSPKFFRESRVTQVSLVLSFSFISMLIHYYAVLLISGSGQMNLPEYIFGLILPSSVYTSVLSALIFPFLVKKFRLEEQEEYL